MASRSTAVPSPDTCPGSGWDTDVSSIPPGRTTESRARSLLAGLGTWPTLTAAAFLTRAKLWFAAHGINHIHRIVTDNGACYRSGDFAWIVGSKTRHQKTKPYTPRHNGKVERYQRILAEELLYAREFTSEDARSAAIAVWNIHYNYHRPHSATGGQPPASRLKLGVTNVLPISTMMSLRMSNDISRCHRSRWSGRSWVWVVNPRE